MRTQSLYQPHFGHGSYTTRNVAKNTDIGKENGLISELVYNERQPAVANYCCPAAAIGQAVSLASVADAAAK